MSSMMDIPPPAMPVLTDEDLLAIVNQVCGAYLQAGPAIILSRDEPADPAPPAGLRTAPGPVSSTASSTASVTASSATTTSVATTSVTGTVSLTGTWNGHLCLGGPPESADEIAARMLQVPIDDLETGDVYDAMGELVNIVAGNAKCLLPPPVQIGLPVVGLGPHDILKFPTSRHTNRLLLSLDGYLIDLAILATNA
jgi:hypothetical protein